MLDDALEDSSRHISIDFKPAEPAEAPPPFAPYEPEFQLSSHGDIISHDHHLNEDGEALYRFLLAQALTPPTYILNIVGTHRERRTRAVTSTVNGTTTTRIENHTVTITDFDFPIDLTSCIAHGPVFWSCPDSDPAFRGLMVRQLNSPRRKATSQEIDIFKVEEHHRRDAGVAPWQAPDGSFRTQDQASSLTPRQWADEYASSPKLLKEFIYEKVIYGWNSNKLSEAIASAIASTSYTGQVNSTFTLYNNKITIRPDNRLSRTLSSTFYKVLLWLTLVFPFIWLFKRFNRHGGGKWEVMGAAYGLKHLEPLDAPQPEAYFSGPEPGQQRHPMHEPRVVETPYGPQRLTGHREGEWFREWEPTIKRCAAMRLSTSEPLTHIGQGPSNPANALDGYAPMNLDGYHPGYLPPS
ncbi:hypothetical protein GALMADRAFT_304991 [Galerina marginata CBS 339.88]|uniref:Uncharacterized protein n=1 Tax=Galerina marginata (strain CBS 339.88) TaxID=685588 RepID=A0A067U0W2_GALM3|nr:hypothetical protein GALMADRAFT_304991 [Galerina marginata CBS 339.88]